ncbi:MAG: LamG domain-containing protein [Candidatus Pacebacteria bacterium]|nr:LamG domain-containing protein [Candidatus Paceibacterota bacterium]
MVTVCDYANKTLKIYRNGVQVGATQNLTGTPVFPSTNKPTYIGAYGSGGADKLTDGSLDDVRIYNRGLSAEEIFTLYNQTKEKYQ